MLMFNQKILSILILFCKYQAKIKMIMVKLLLFIFNYNSIISISVYLREMSQKVNKTVDVAGHQIK